MLNVIVVDVGFAGSEHWLPAIQESKNMRTVGVVDILPEARAKALSMLPSGVWAKPTIQQIPDSVPRDTLVLVATPDHFPVVKGLAEMGFKNLIIEKPLVSRDGELGKFMKLAKQSGLRVYALDHHIQKAFSLQVVLGIVNMGDPRLEMLTIDGAHELEEIPGILGKIEGVNLTNIEAGDLGIPYLDQHPWVEHDPVLGGIIRDLGPHAFAPLAAAQLLKDNATILYVKLAKLSKDRRGLEPVTSRDDIEMYVFCLLAQEGTSLVVTFGKVPTAGGERSLVVHGKTGFYFLELPRNRDAVVMTHDGKTTRLSLRVSTNRFVVEEIYLFYKGLLPSTFDGHLQAAYTALITNMRIRKAYFLALSQQRY